MGTGRGDVDLFDFERLGSGPAYSGLAPDGLGCGAGHGVR